MRILAALMFSMILLTTTLLLHAVATNEAPTRRSYGADHAGSGYG